MIDPRLAIIDKRLSGIEEILVFASSKGGVGKSICAAASALLMAKKGLRTGLLDLDFHGASAHIFVNAPLALPEESHGILPHKAAFNLGFMSIAGFTGENPVPLRGKEVSNAIIELLTVTVWGKRDVLIVDMPPGIGDEIMDLIRLVKRFKIIVISSPSLVSERIVRRLLELLQELKVPVCGLLENMSLNEHADSATNARQTSPSRQMAQNMSVPFLGSIPFFPDLENSIDKPRELVTTEFARLLDKILSDLK